METLEKIAEMKEWINEEYAQCNQVVHPCHPNILVRVIPKGETKIKVAPGINLYTPDKVQNKPNYEGQVLEVYPTWFEYKNVRCEKCKSRCERQVIWHESEFKVGDHVMFQHFQGIPVPLDGFKGDYRMIPENTIFAVLEYRKQSVKKTFLKKVENFFHSSASLEALWNEIAEEFEVVLKETNKTLSGS